MNQTKTQLIKNIAAKVDTNKISNLRQEYPKSKTLRQLVNCEQRIQESNNDQEVFRLGTRIAYYLDAICDPNKADYVKSEEEKKHLLAISKELFENTIGVKE